MPVRFGEGYLVRPLLTFRRTDKSDAFQDWAGVVSAQGVVIFDNGTDTQNSAEFWDQYHSANIAETGLLDNYYTVRIWNVVTQQFETYEYPDTYLDFGKVNGVTVTEILPDPAIAANVKAATLARTRT